MTARVDLITADGAVHNLDQLVQQGIQGVTGLVRVPEKRGGNLVVPGSHGELHIPAKKYGANTLVAPMWVRGVNPDGSVPGGDDVGARLAFHQNLRILIDLFTVDELVTIRHTLTDGTARQITGEVTDAVEPEVDSYGRYTNGQFPVALNCADPFWTDLVDTVATLTSGGPTTLTGFAGADAWMENLLITFAPQSNPRLDQVSTGLFVAVGRVITAGQTVSVNTATWQVYGTGGVAAHLYEDLTYGGRGTRRWFALAPEPGGGPPVVELTETGPGTGTATITGRRRYKIG